MGRLGGVSGPLGHGGSAASATRRLRDHREEKVGAAGRVGNDHSFRGASEEEQLAQLAYEVGEQRIRAAARLVHLFACCGAVATTTKTKKSEMNSDEYRICTAKNLSTIVTQAKRKKI